MSEGSPQLPFLNLPTAGFKAPEFRIIYVNAFRFRVSPADFMVTFGVQTDHPINPNLTAVKDEVAIALTLPHLKLLATHLTAAVTALEAQYGEITIPAGVGIPVGGIDEMVRQLHEQATAQAKQSG